MCVCGGGGGGYAPSSPPSSSTLCMGSVIESINPPNTKCKPIDYSHAAMWITCACMVNDAMDDPEHAQPFAVRIRLLFSPFSRCFF